MEKKFSNHLINETSVYLLQHAHNPVNWYSWSDEAIAKAQKEDKPILVSIGYSACHWCHVMERESFEDEATAALMNEFFINIKVDKEERPDIDHIYMDAVQTIAGNGGWPLNVFLTPDLKPFYGGTYFPPQPAFNRSSWKQVINAVSLAFKEKRNEVEEQAESLRQHLSNSNNLFKSLENDKSLSDDVLTNITNQLLNSADKVWGGFGAAPKFPQTFSILFLLRHYFFSGDENALKQATLSLDKMIMGGMYDHLGGGFARYSTDKKWQIPHFEKMLYDNALLIDVYTEAYQLTKKQEYANVVDETIQFIKAEMTASGGGFYSALDADSEGVEGKYYIWSKEEIDELLGNQSETFCKIFNVLEEGNWEATNILWQPESLNYWSEKFEIEKDALSNQINSNKKILLEERQKRIRPTLDNKIILSWNCLMVKSLCKASAAFSNENYLRLAESCMTFIEQNFMISDESFCHSWNKMQSKQEAFLDDYAALIQAYIYLFQLNGKEENLFNAKKLTEKVIVDFSDEENTAFYFTSLSQENIIVRKKELYDGATPSGNALMAENLLLLSVYFALPEWKQRAEKMILNMSSFIEKYPLSFGYWSLNLQILLQGLKEIIITGCEIETIREQILREYIPIKVMQWANKANNYWPLLKGRENFESTNIYLCENYTCLKPSKTFEEFKKALRQTFLTKNP